MKLMFFWPLLFCAATGFAQQDSTWVLDNSTLTYTVTHPIHQIEGVSHAARGKGVCHAGECDFLVAAQVKSFESGDNNRDLHMLQTVKGAQFPVVAVRLRLPESELSAATLKCDLEVQFAGQTAHYTGVPFTQTVSGDEHHISGTVPSTVADFKIDPPSFFTVTIRNEIPVNVAMAWRRQK